MVIYDTCQTGEHVLLSLFCTENVVVACMIFWACRRDTHFKKHGQDILLQSAVAHLMC
jgi:hypothetical protein